MKQINPIMVYLRSCPQKNQRIKKKKKKKKKKDFKKFLILKKLIFKQV